MELKPHLVGEDDRVKKIKNKLTYDFADFINSFEHNSMKSNWRWWKGMEETINELEQTIINSEEDNKIKAQFNLKELTEQRNKLNREISTLKKATLNN